MSKIIVSIIVMSVIAYFGYYICYLFNYTKEYPECRFSNDFVTCVAIGKAVDGK